MIDCFYTTAEESLSNAEESSKLRSNVSGNRRHTVQQSRQLVVRAYCYNIYTSLPQALHEWQEEKIEKEDLGRRRKSYISKK